MSTHFKNQKTVGRLNKIDKAIVNLKRGKNRLSIAQIAEKAGISRKTIYNHAELKERCDQAIHLQEIEQRNKEKIQKREGKKQEIIGKQPTTCIGKGSFKITYQYASR